MDLAIIDQSKPGVPAEQIDLVEKVLDYAGEYMKLPADTEMSVTFVNNDEIQRYNREYRGLDKQLTSSHLLLKKMVMICH